MKTFISTLSFLLIISFAFPQESNSEVRYLFQGQNNLSVSGFGGFSSYFGMAKGNASSYSGGGGAVLFDYKFFVGAFGMGLSQMNSYANVRLHQNSDLIDDLTYSYGVGGMWLGYSFNHQNPIHFAVSLKSGIGSIDVFPRGFEHFDKNIFTDIVYSFLPEIMLEINMLRWWRLHFQAGYLFTWGIDNKVYYNEANEPKRYFNKNDFSSPMIGFGMIFGIFGPKK